MSAIEADLSAIVDQQLQQFLNDQFMEQTDSLLGELALRTCSMIRVAPSETRKGEYKQKIN